MIRGRTRPLPVKVDIVPVIIPPEAITLNADFKTAIHNRFDIEVIDARTGEVKRRARAENIICAALWARMFSSTASERVWNSYIQYGTGAGTPAATDTGLFTFLGYGAPAISDDEIDYAWDSGYVSIRRKIMLNESTANGSTLTEVGIAYGTTAATLCTHAMLKDMNGNAVSIAKTNTDIINIYATVFVHWETAGYDNGYIKMICGKMGLAGTYYSGLLAWAFGLPANGVYTMIIRFSAGGYSPSANIPVYTGQSGLTQAMSSANKTLSITATRLAVDVGNISGIKSVLMSMGSTDHSVVLQVGGAWYPGTPITGEAIGTGDGTIKDFATDFPFISAATIYVDGVAVSSGLTVDTDKPQRVTTMGVYFEQISGDAIAPPETTTANQTGTAVYYNPYYALGIVSFYRNSDQVVEVSNDLSEWVTLSGGGTVGVPEAYRNYKYWRITLATNANINTFTTSGATANNIHFAAPPASGAVITADYTTKTIAKDSNHVFDLTVTIQLGEHVT